MPFPLRASLLGLACLLSLAARGDVFRLGEVTLTAGASANVYVLLADLPAELPAHGVLLAPRGCTVLPRPSYPRGQRALHSWEIACEAPLQRGSRLTLPFALDAVNLQVDIDGWQQRSSVSGTGSYTTALELERAPPARRALRETAAEYLWQGVVHIAAGWDHLAFVLCLCLLAASIRQLLWAVTLFTLGHSLSLALAFHGVVALPLPPVEAFIALSIVFVARDAWLRHDARSAAVRGRRLLPVVALFGLVHGLGFAAVLGALGVAADERLAALAFFNVGVELGQLLFVTLVLALRYAARALSAAPLLDRVALLCAGSTGCFWTLERIAGFSAAST